MPKNINLIELERKAYRSTFQDGLWDIFWGLLILGFGLSPWLYELGIPGPWNTAVVMLPAPLLIVLGKKYITIPRLGTAQFNMSRKLAKSRGRITLAISVIIPLIVILFFITDIIKIGLGRFVVAMSAGLFLIIVLSLIAYFLDFSRLYIYAWMFAISLIIAEYLSPYTGIAAARLIACGLFSIIILIIGIALFVQFLSDTKLTREALDE